MPGVMAVIGECWSCGQVFVFSPTKVPSIRIDGIRQPICATCVARANVLREAKGEPLIVPLPGAFDGDALEDMPWDDEHGVGL